MSLLRFCEKFEGRSGFSGGFSSRCEGEACASMFERVREIGVSRAQARIECFHVGAGF